MGGADVVVLVGHGASINNSLRSGAPLVAFGLTVNAAVTEQTGCWWGVAGKLSARIGDVAVTRHTARSLRHMGCAHAAATVVGQDGNDLRIRHRLKRICRKQP